MLFGFYFVTSFVAAVGPSSWFELLVQMVAVTLLGLFAMRSQGLWVSRFNAVRAIELSRITRAVVIMGLGTIVLDRFFKLYFHVEDIFVGCVAAWLVDRRAGARSTGRGCRRSARPTASCAPS